MKKLPYAWRPLRAGEPWTLEVWAYRVGAFTALYVAVLLLVGWLSGWKLP